MLRLPTRLTISDETVALADSIVAGEHMLETLEGIMECKDLAELTVNMTPVNASLGGILSYIVGSSNVHLRLQFSLLCGVRRIWKEYVLDGSQSIPYRLLEISGFAGFILHPSALQKVLPLPRGGVYDFLMRVQADDSRRSASWFQYIIAMRDHLPMDGIDDICKVILDHPHVLVAECIVKACMETRMPVDVFSGDMVRRTLLQCMIPSRRRLRCGSRTESSRSVVLARWISSWMDESAHAAVLIRDLIFNEILMRVDLENMNFELLGAMVSKTQDRLPFIPLREEDLTRIPNKVRETSKTWCDVVERIQRLPPTEERVLHPVWAVRRHY